MDDQEEDVTSKGKTREEISFNSSKIAGYVQVHAMLSPNSLLDRFLKSMHGMMGGLTRYRLNFFKALSLHISFFRPRRVKSAKKRVIQQEKVFYWDDVIEGHGNGQMMDTGIKLVELCN